MDLTPGAGASVLAEGGSPAATVGDPVRLRSAAVLVTLASRVAVLALSFASAVLLARGLGPSARGVLALAVLSSQALALLCGFGLGLAAMHFAATPAQVRDASRAIATLTVAGSVLSTVLAVLLATYVAHSGAAFVEGLTAGEVLLAGMAVPPLIGVAALVGLLRGVGRMRAAAWVDAAGAAVMLGATAVALLALHGGVEAALWAQVAGPVAGCLLGLYALRGAGASIRPSTDRPWLARVAGFGLRGDLGNLAYLVTLRFDTVVVNAAVGNAALGVYTVATRLADIVWLVPYSVALVVLPHASGRSAAVLDRSTPRLAARTLGLGLLTAAVLALLAAVGLSAVFGAAYSGALAPMLLLLPGVAVFGFGNVLAADLAGRGHPGYITVNAGIGIVVTVVLDLLVIPVHGVMGAAAVSLVVYLLNAALSVAFFLRVTGLPLSTYAAASLGRAA